MIKTEQTGSFPSCTVTDSANESYSEARCKLCATNFSFFSLEKFMTKHKDLEVKKVALEEQLKQLGELFVSSQTSTELTTERTDLQQ